ncbi:hypothetical protein [Mycoplasma sp. 3686d]|uniref:hypothetical protein n=1 Tax=Mycoplasma sp. 3686d TaxID=2967300 RepID=UPI00211C7F9F|nr:hypothetical protein [Mycoplasma sp. 3686d]UUM24555.1 hypothetical protein NPA12_02535 [Mycoplasma sp. 3686d]
MEFFKVYKLVKYNDNNTELILTFIKNDKETFFLKLTEDFNQLSPFSKEHAIQIHTRKNKLFVEFEPIYFVDTDKLVKSFKDITNQITTSINNQFKLKILDLLKVISYERDNFTQEYTPVFKNDSQKAFWHSKTPLFIKLWTEFLEKQKIKPKIIYKNLRK